MNTLQFLKDTVRDKKTLYFCVFFSFSAGRIFDLFLPLVFKFLIDFSSKYIETKSSETLHDIFMFSALLILMALLSRFSFRVYDYFEAKFIPAISAEIPIKIFKYISNHSTSYFDNNFSGEIVHKIKQINDITKNMLVLFPINIFTTSLTLLITIAIILPKSLILGLSILIFGILYLFASYYLANKNKELASVWSEKNSKFSGHLIDSVENMILVKSFGKQRFELDKIKEYATEEKDTLLNLKLNVTKIKIIHTLVSSSIIIFVTFYSLYLYLNGLITLGDFVFNYTIITRLTGEFYAIGELTSDMLEKYGIFKTAIGFIYKKQSDDMSLPDIKVTNGEIVFENVNFKYNQDYIFKNFNLKIKEKEKIALVGYSGSGKSTIVKMLLKQYPNESGSISIDKQDIKKYNTDSINNQITYVNQNIYLFNRSIRDNIIYVKPQASEEELIDVCKKSGCLDFILEKEQGFDTVVGERGVQLSGGEKQRIAIARAFLLDNPILILDEPTAALDSLSESLIQKSLKDLMKNKTVIIIAHRLSTIKNMDRILVMEKGQIVEDGNHDVLLSKNGKYENLWKGQKF